MPKQINPWLLAIIAVIMSRLFSMFLLPFIDTTEPRYAEIARLMAATGDWITPWFEPGVPFWGKPPLAFWAQAASIRLFGGIELAIRLPAMLATLATLFVLWKYTLIKAGPVVARWSTFIYITMALPFVSAGAVMTDAFLVLGTTLSLMSFDLAINCRRQIWGSLFFVGLITGLLAKGPLALVLTGIPVFFCYVIAPRRLRELRALPWGKGLVVTALLVLPWYIAAEIKTPGFIDYFIVGEHFKRFMDPGWAGDMYGSAHDQPKGMIWIFWLWASFPWGVLALLMTFKKNIKQRISHLIHTLRDDRTIQFLFFCALSPLLFFTVAGNILWTYALPSLPFSAILIARWFVCLHTQSSAPSHRSLAVSALVPVCITVGALAVSLGLLSVNSQKSLVAQYYQQALKQDGTLLFVGSLPFSARFYSSGRAQQVSVEQLSTMLQNPQQAHYFVAVPNRRAHELQRSLTADIARAFNNQNYQLLHITPIQINLDESS